jgi:hypothetical protein
MEVLISMFIVAIGLVSIASLIPVGGLQVQKANVEERKAELGMNAFREFQVRGMGTFSPTGNLPWLRDSGASYQPLNLTAPSFTDAPYLPPVAIDPVMIARSIKKYSPYDIDPTAQSELQYFPCSQSGTAPAVVMHRLSLSGFLQLLNNNSTNADVSRALCEAVFTATDDLVTSQPDDRSQPGTGALDSTSSKRDYEGHYSWMATLTPYYPTSTPVAPAPMDQYTLSVVAFSRRTLPPNPISMNSFDNSLVHEWMVGVQQPPGANPAPNIGGGDVTLIVPLTDDQVTAARPGNWLMLCRTDASLGRIFTWYRVVAAATDETTGNLQVTLAGGDWIWGDTSHPTYACLFDGAVAVYQKVIHLEGPSIWQQ